MSRHLTTICCRHGAGIANSVRSVIAIALLASQAPIVVVRAADAVKQRPTSVFPTDIRWTTLLGSPAADQPGFDASHAYVPLRTGQIVAVSLGSGAIAWVTELPTTFAPASGDGAIYVAKEDTIHSIQMSDAAVQWQVRLDARISAPPLWVAGWLIAGLESGEVVALRSKDGTTVWRRSLGSATRVHPAIEGDRLFVALEDGRVVCLNLVTGQLVWQLKLDDSATGILALPDRLFIGAKDGFFYSLSSADGVERWRWRTGADTVGSPIFDDKNVYYVGFDNVLRALDLTSGIQRWRKALRTRPNFGPVMAGGVLVVSGLTSELRAYFSEDGADAGVFISPSEVAAQPHVKGKFCLDAGNLVILTGDGRLFGLSRRILPVELPLASIPGTITPVVEVEPAAVPADPGSLPLEQPPALQTPSTSPAEDEPTPAQTATPH